MTNPKAKIWFQLVIACVLIGFALFISAGTIAYWQAWVFLGVLAVCSVLLTLSVIGDPILLENRTGAGRLRRLGRFKRS
jgi:Na+/pantothenate symporter